uniref:ATP synthase mitochondrial F1 complex assembly factor 2 n=1 Tax=Cacopsylla melanoneura TaxID=428564 RepID=A0A8D8URB8_9HEMI
MLKSVVRIFPQASCLLSRQQIIPARCPALLNLVKIQFNQYSSLEKPKRFYKKVGILQSNGDYEITLDHRKLKTPNGVLFKVSSEPLALAIAAEWDAQCDKIERSSMHLTGICNTVIDNPNRLTKFDLVQNIINFLETDTILYHTQIGHWGRVEWAHDLDQQELQARVAAAIFYVHVNSLNESNGIKKKASN